MDAERKKRLKKGKQKLEYLANQLFIQYVWRSGRIVASTDPTLEDEEDNLSKPIYMHSSSRAERKK